jgi:hypothetical protein
MALTSSFGELVVNNLLSQLPSNEFTCYIQPRIDNQASTRYPDFVVVCRSLGVLAIEVKDWNSIIKENCDQLKVQIRKKNGEILNEENPSRTAKKYADNLIQLFEKRRELMERYNRIDKLSFPCVSVTLFL